MCFLLGGFQNGIKAVFQHVGGLFPVAQSHLNRVGRCVRNADTCVWLTAFVLASWDEVHDLTNGAVDLPYIDLRNTFSCLLKLNFQKFGLVFE